MHSPRFDSSLILPPAHKLTPAGLRRIADYLEAAGHSGHLVELDVIEWQDFVSEIRMASEAVDETPAIDALGRFTGRRP